MIETTAICLTFLVVSVAANAFLLRYYHLKYLMPALTLLRYQWSETGKVPSVRMEIRKPRRRGAPPAVSTTLEMRKRLQPLDEVAVAEMNRRLEGTF